MKEKRQLKYPLFADGVSSAMATVNCDLEELYAMLKVMKEGEGFVEIDEEQMIRFLDLMKEIMDLEGKV